MGTREKQKFYSGDFYFLSEIRSKPTSSQQGQEGINVQEEQRKLEIINLKGNTIHGPGRMAEQHFRYGSLNSLVFPKCVEPDLSVPKGLDL